MQPCTLSVLCSFKISLVAMTTCLGSEGMWHYFDTHVIKTEHLLDLPGLVQKCIQSGETDNMTGSILYV